MSRNPRRKSRSRAYPGPNWSCKLVHGTSWLLPAGTRRAADLVQTLEGLQAAVARLLASTVVVPGLGEARAVVRARPELVAVTSDGDVHLGQVGGADFFISRSQFAVWQHTHIMLDVVPGRGGMFSLENGREKRFHIRSRLFSQAENDALSGACRL